MRKKYIGLLCFALLGQISVLVAQNFLGLQSSNYAGTYGLYTQPASVADNRLRFDVNLAGVSTSFINNYAGVSILRQYFKDPILRDSLTTAGAAYPDPRNQYFPRHQNGNKNYMYFNNDVYGPLSFMVTLSPKHGFGFSWRNRFFLNADNVAQNAFDLAYSEKNDTNYLNKDFSIDKMRILAASYNEYALTYGRVVMDKGKHFVKAGGTFKILQGFAGANLYSNGGTFNLNNDSIADVSNVNMTYNASNIFDINVPANRNAWPYIKKELKGSFGNGYGFDLGAVYEYRPKHEEYFYEKDGKKLPMRDKNKYKLRVGISILDIGKVTYKRSPNSVNFSGLKQDLFINPRGYTTYPQLTDSLIKKNFAATSTTPGFTFSLPTVITAQIDYNIAKRLYVNFMPYISLKNYNSPNKIVVASNFSITPRYEGRWLGIAVPLSIDQNRQFNMGLTLRAGPLVVGSNYLGAAWIQKDVRAADIHVALRIPIAYRTKADKDGDGIKDKRDNCPDIAGVAALKGCPDKDGDGVTDAEDACPDTPGDKETKGCPDTDGDGIYDHEDGCPKEKGTKEMNGCPDTDGDGITNNEDACPLDAGSKEMKGCPDRDGDGIADNEDNCPDVKGARETYGCPDADKDGIVDKDDACPSVFGVKEFKGCPDTDGDGISDAEDVCPTNKGTKPFKGCPDTDGDGIPDNEDACPTVFGYIAEKGCPHKVNNDIDGDGIENLLDVCPTIPGLPQFKGCPDTDKDGVEDKYDECLTIPGLAKFGGCPDTDNDGIEDRKDACQTEPGIERYVGCPIPDTDGDGINDEMDKCPLTPGVPEEQGCPKIEQPQEAIAAFENLEFETAKATILPASIETLKRLGDYLAAHPTYLLQISGHTDADGNEKANLSLSMRRAEAVKTYLVNHGIPVERLMTAVYGETTPITDNETAEGKQHNRRVELIVIPVK